VVVAVSGDAKQIGIADLSAFQRIFECSLSEEARRTKSAKWAFFICSKCLFAAIKVVGLREGRDDADRNYRQTRMLLGQHPDLAGIYNIGGGADGVARALKEMDREREVVFIGHGLTADTRSLLIDGTMDAVITQNPLNAMMGCVAIFNNLRAGREAMHGVEAPRSEIILFRRKTPSFKTGI
jgi:LacI family transcriptional regulator